MTLLLLVKRVEGVEEVPNKLPEAPDSWPNDRSPPDPSVNSQQVPSSAYRFGQVVTVRYSMIDVVVPGCQLPVLFERRPPRQGDEHPKGTYRLQSLCAVIPTSSSMAAATGLAAGDVRIIGGVLLRHRETAVESRRERNGLGILKARNIKIRSARATKYQVPRRKGSEFR